MNEDLVFILSPYTDIPIHPNELFSKVTIEYHYSQIRRKIKVRPTLKQTTLDKYEQSFGIKLEKLIRPLFIYKPKFFMEICYMKLAYTDLSIIVSPGIHYGKILYKHDCDHISLAYYNIFELFKDKTFTNRIQYSSYSSEESDYATLEESSEESEESSE